MSGPFYISTFLHSCISTFLYFSTALPARAAATSAAAAAAEAAKSAAEPAARPAAEGADAARPAAPPAAAPAAHAAHAEHAEHAERSQTPAEEEDDDHDRKDDCRGDLPAVSRALRRRVDTCQGDVAPLRDASGNPCGACDEAGAVPAVPEFRDHVVPARFTGEAVGDPWLESVPDFDPDLSLLHGHQHQHAVVFALVADAPAVILEELD